MILVVIDLAISGNIFQIRCLRDAEILFPHVETMLWLAIALYCVCMLLFVPRAACSSAPVPGVCHKEKTRSWTASQVNAQSDIVSKSQNKQLQS